MPAPSQLAIATSSLQRLTKEEVSYHKELQMQQKRIDQLEKEQTEETDEDRGNHEFQLKQEVRAQMTDFHFLFSHYPSAHSQYHSFYMTFHYLLKPNTFLQRKGLEETKAIIPSLH